MFPFFGDSAKVSSSLPNFVLAWAGDGKDNNLWGWVVGQTGVWPALGLTQPEGPRRCFALGKLARLAHRKAISRSAGPPLEGRSGQGLPQLVLLLQETYIKLWPEVCIWKGQLPCDSPMALPLNSMWNGDMTSYAVLTDRVWRKSKQLYSPHLCRLQKFPHRDQHFSSAAGGVRGDCGRWLLPQEIWLALRERIARGADHQ